MTSWRASTGAFWPFLAILLQLLICQFTRAGNVTKQSNDICAQKNRPGFTLNLTSAMIFPAYLLIIDGKYLVYKVPRESLDSYGSMTFNIPGVPIEKMWPTFKNDSSWPTIKTEYKDIYHIFDKLNNSWIYMDIMNGVGLRYNLGKQKMDSGFLYSSNYKEQLITNDNATRIYSIQVKNKAPHLPNMFVWKFFFDGLSVSGSPTPTDGFQMYYLVDKRNPSQKNLTVFSGGPFSPEKNPLVGLAGYEKYRLENISDWHFEAGHIPVGFIYKGFFHLYDFDKIMIFADAMPSFETVQQIDSQAGTLLMNVKVTFISVKSYFQCGSDASELDSKHLVTYPHIPMPFALPTKGTPLLLYISISVAVLAILVIIALIVYCLTVGSSRKKSKSKHHKKGDRNKKKKKGEEGGSIHTGVGASLEKKHSRGTVHSRATGQSRPSAKLSLPK